MIICSFILVLIFKALSKAGENQGEQNKNIEEFKARLIGVKFEIREYKHIGFIIFFFLVSVISIYF